MGITAGVAADDCPGEGRFPDSSNCGAYVDCVDDGNGGYNARKGDCDGFMYNATSGECSKDGMVSIFYCFKVIIYGVNESLSICLPLIFVHLDIYSVLTRVTPGVLPQT